MRKFIPILFCSFALFWSGSVLATPNNAAAEANKACAADIQKFCAKETTGGGHLGRCIMQHREEFSAPCQEFMQKVQTQVKSFYEACKNDLKQYCSEVKPGQGHMLGCLREHHDSLSSTCQQIFDKR